MTLVITVSRAMCVTAESTTSSRNVILGVRHVEAGVSKTREVNSGPTAGDCKNAPVVWRLGEPAVCTDQRSSKDSERVCVVYWYSIPGVSDTQDTPVCREGVYGCGVLL